MLKQLKKHTHNKRFEIIISSFIVLIFITIFFILLKSNLEVDISDFLIEGICGVSAIICFLISLKLKKKYLSFGWGLFSISSITDVTDELKFIPRIDIVDNIFEEFFMVSGIILIVYGFYNIINEKEKLLGDAVNISYVDPLTNLPNRRYIKDQVKLLINKFIMEQKKAGIVFIDLDRFKLINDSFGHSIGDELLAEVADRLKEVINEEDIFARLGGDEFIIVIDNVESLYDINCTAEKIIHLLKEPFLLNNKQITVTCSIGISILPDHGKDIDTLFKNADIAMYTVKEKGRNGYKVYDHSMEKQAIRTFEMSESLIKAQRRKEFILHYQPKVNIITGEVTGLEALVRWDHPDKGLIYPDEFILIAEQTGLIKQIDIYVLEMACLQINEWIRTGFKPINIAVNISAKLFNDYEFIDKLKEILVRTDIDPSFLTIEITETAAMEDIDYAYRIMSELNTYGIKIALDDFGTGYSSLSYLKRFPIDVLKIDKVFIDGIAKDNRDESLIRAAITMAKALNINVISEGVETKDQLIFLKSISCDEYQGYLFSKPLPIMELQEKILCQRKTNKSTAP